jgi:hypothetical protein
MVISISFVFAIRTMTPRTHTGAPGI